MSKTPFKTPNPKKRTMKRSNSSPSSLDTETSGEDDQSVSLAVLSDDLFRMVNQQLQEKAEIEEAFLHHVKETKKMYAEYVNTKEELRRTQLALNNVMEERNEMERHLLKARGMLDEEKDKCRQLTREMDNLLKKIASVQETLGRGVIEETCNQLSNLHSHGQRALDTHRDRASGRMSFNINSTGSVLSEMSVSGDDLDKSLMGRKWQKYVKPGEHPEEPSRKKRRSSTEQQQRQPVHIATTETVRATTTVTVSREGPITATSVIESLPEEPEVAPVQVHAEGVAQVETPQQVRAYHRMHDFHRKTNMMLGNCMVCDRQLGFAKTTVYCKECKVSCHVGCKGGLPLPCIPRMNTPNVNPNKATIGDFAPNTPPMVPPLIMMCVEEIERRGMQEIGLYRVPGSEMEVKNLKEKLLNGSNRVNLKTIDVHVLCCCIKLFLRSLAEPLIPKLRCRDFFQAVEAQDPQDTDPALIQLIAELPKPNLHTLAYLMLHLQRVADSTDCMMPVANLAKLLAPTIVGYASDDLNQGELLEQTRQTIKVMERLLQLQANLWSGLMSTQDALRQTPSSESLRGFFSTPRSKIFMTPPVYKKGG